MDVGIKCNEKLAQGIEREQQIAKMRPVLESMYNRYYQHFKKQTHNRI
jgi:hypothetical protein